MPKALVGEQDEQVNNARETIAHGEGALAEEWAARAAAATLILEAHEVHTQSYGDRERNAHASKREEGKRRKACKGSQGS